MKNYKNEAIAFLSEYRRITEQKKIIDEQMFSYAELYRELLKTSTFAETQKEGSDKRFNSYKSTLEEKMDELQIRRSRLMLRQRLIESIVGRLNKTEYEVIKVYYIYPDTKGKAEELMGILDFEKTHIYRIKDRALEKIGKIIAEFSNLYEDVDGYT